MHVGTRPPISEHDLIIPENFSLGIARYTCGSPFIAPPSKFDADNGRRHLQALVTWKIKCLYSLVVRSTTHSYCISLSAFYSDTIQDCAECGIGESFPLPLSPPVVRYTLHRSPIRVHWHVKTSYKGHWRAKVTIWNFNNVKNYSHWNLCGATSEPRKCCTDDTGFFWGSTFYNDVLLQAGDNGVVQTEILLVKDLRIFTF
ncbi:hypothetical protein HHK36_030394 [Tetracentron sinense]|uniref:COBRA C-terminal domain-containing protein n=1 Tax=Tetracentron sinense TaxID=13715 RepID=A0A835CYN2_TETSI|nr:hypothetical protein HHK36_030394 [Tetracentron sinense]